MVFALFRGKHLRCDEVFICVFAKEDSAQSTAGVLLAGVYLAKKPSDTLTLADIQNVWLHRQEPAVTYCCCL